MSGSDSQPRPDRPVVRPLLATAAALSLTDAGIYLAAAPSRFESLHLALLPVTGKTVLTASLIAVLWWVAFKVLRRRVDSRIVARTACAAAVIAYLADWASFLPPGGPILLGAALAVGAAVAYSRLRPLREGHAPGATPLKRPICVAQWVLVCAALASSGGIHLGSSVRDRVARAHTTDGHVVPRVILVVVDTLRADALSCYGSLNPTPHIDALASDGVVYDVARAPSPWTLPSMASLFTGVPPQVHGVDTAHSALPDRWITLAERLDEAGYRTCAIGRNRFLVDRGFDQGFQRYDFFPRPRAELPLAKVFPFIHKRYAARHASTEQLVDRAIGRLDVERDLDSFLWLHLFDPHQPYTPPTEYLARAPDTGRVEGTFDRLDEVRDGTFVPTQAEVERIRALYLAEVRYVDDQVGRIVDHLKVRGLYDETLIVLTSDHGEELWEHGGYEHGHTLYEELLRVPLVVKTPGTPPRREAGAVSLEDIAPIVLQACGITSEGTAAHDRHHATANLYGPPLESVHFGQHKLIHSLDGGGHELYDLGADPGETRDLAAERPEEVFHARGLLAEHAARAATTGDRLEAPPPTRLDLDEGARDQLRELGYIE